MAYDPTVWEDRVVERPRTYQIQNNPDGTITLIPAPGQVYEEGTPVNATNLNKLEQGLKTHETDNTAHGITSKVLGPSSAINGNIAIFDGTTGKKVKDSGITLTTNKGSALITDTVTPEGKTITIPIGAGERRGLFVMHVPDAGDKAIVFFGTYEDGAVCIYKYSSNVHVKSESDKYLANYVTGSNGARLTRAYISGSNLCLEFNVPATSDEDINCYVKWEVW